MLAGLWFALLLILFTIYRSTFSSAVVFCIVRRLSALKLFSFGDFPYFVHFIESTSRSAPDLLTILGHSK